MKLQNEETGQVENFCIDKDQICSCDRAFVYDSLAQLQEAGWKDYEEPREFWFIDPGVSGNVASLEFYSDETRENMKKIGFDFDTKEEAEKAVEKLKAWKRLKDCRFKFRGWEDDKDEEHNYAIIHCFMPSLTRKRGIWEPMSFEDIQDDLNLLFGGEE